MAKDTHMDKPAAKSRSRKPQGQARAKLVVKLGATEVQFEAGLGAVEERFDRVMGQLLEAWRAESSAPQAKVPPPPSAKPTTPVVAMRRVAELSADETPHRYFDLPPSFYPTFSLDLADVAEFYAVTADNDLSLRYMPRRPEQRDRNADALMLLLYGKLVLQGESPVTAVALLKASDQSGFDIDRASRLLARRSRYVHASGQRRGRRYRLTDEGVKYCEDLLKRMGAGASGSAG